MSIFGVSIFGRRLYESKIKAKCEENMKLTIRFVHLWTCKFKITFYRLIFFAFRRLDAEITLVMLAKNNSKWSFIFYWQFDFSVADNIFWLQLFRTFQFSRILITICTRCLHRLLCNPKHYFDRPIEVIRQHLFLIFKHPPSTYCLLLRREL